MVCKSLAVFGKMRNTQKEKERWHVCLANDKGQNSVIVVCCK